MQDQLPIRLDLLPHRYRLQTLMLLLNRRGVLIAEFRYVSRTAIMCSAPPACPSVEQSIRSLPTRIMRIESAESPELIALPTLPSAYT
jgi:hypothetical protein